MRAALQIFGARLRFLIQDQNFFAISDILCCKDCNVAIAVISYSLIQITQQASAKL